MKPETCPNCGSDVPPSAKVCPECGSCEETGWSEDTYLDGVSLPEEEFDYDDYIQKEFGDKPQVVPKGLHWFWWAVGIVVVIAFILLVLFVFV